MKFFILTVIVLIVICISNIVFSRIHLVTFDLITNENGNTPFITHLYQKSCISTWFLAPLNGKWIQLGVGIKQEFKGIKTTWLLSSPYSSRTKIDQKRVELEGILPIVFITAEKGFLKLELQNRYYIEFPKEKISYDWLRSDVTFGKTLRLGARNEFKVFEREDKKSVSFYLARFCIREPSSQSVGGSQWGFEEVDGVV